MITIFSDLNFIAIEVLFDLSEVNFLLSEMPRLPLTLSYDLMERNNCSKLKFT